MCEIQVHYSFIPLSSKIMQNAAFNANKEPLEIDLRAAHIVREMNNFKSPIDEQLMEMQIWIFSIWVFRFVILQ